MYSLNTTAGIRRHLQSQQDSNKFRKVKASDATSFSFADMLSKPTKGCYFTNPYCRFRSQWPSGQRRGSAADRLLRLRVRIPLGAYLCCMCYSVRTKDKNQGNQDKEVRIKYRDRTKKKIPLGAWMFVFCVLLPLLRADHLSRGVVPCVCVCVCSDPSSILTLSLHVLWNR